MRAAAIRLLAADGPLARDLSPAMLLAPDRTELAANAAAAALRPLLRHPPMELAAAFAAAQEGAVQRLAALEAPPTDAQSRPISFDLTLLPCGNAVLVLARDVSLERALRGALIDSRQRLKDLVDRAADFTWEVDAEGRFSFVSGQRPLGFAAADLIGRKPSDLAISSDSDAAFAGVGPHAGAEIWLKGAGDIPVCLLVQGQALEAGDGSFRGARGLARDVTEQKAREADLAEARHRERLVLHLMRSLRRNIDPDSALAAALETAIQAVGADLGSVHRLDGGVIGACLAGTADADDAVLSPTAIESDNGLAMGHAGHRHGIAFVCRHEGRPVGLLVLWRQDGRGPWAADDIFLLSELAEQVAVLIEQLKGHEALRQLSTTDALTGLLNRRGFETVLARAVTRARLDGQGGALMYVDLDNFKQVNDRFGHAQGDAALVATADILRENLRTRDPIGRLGGDEFVAWLDGVGPEEAKSKAQELQRAAADLARFAPGTDRPLGFSIGIALMRPAAQDGVDDLERLMARADEAMYRIKHGGKGGFVLVE
ncbi:diguanylate cyclase (GGDEF)-like protein [Dongia mobilis]|uniref:diguanylate cyclase n=1 Tax=Dongia mobilis TaxID=578943 RepID=A0A4R6X300_9PROT|nr:diguanylate cyclase [Dongia mobilis]TDQ86482.1 diguanylate cyclase (GGDEF)-like protein [Dongia mobilis]